MHLGKTYSQASKVNFEELCVQERFSIARHDINYRVKKLFVHVAIDSACF